VQRIVTGVVHTCSHLCFLFGCQYEYSSAPYRDDSTLKFTRDGILVALSAVPDGRVRLDFNNPCPDEVAVLMTARRR
jgi:hypothetical protein